jgi:hypothetical protein
MDDHAGGTYCERPTEGCPGSRGADGVPADSVAICLAPDLLAVGVVDGEERCLLAGGKMTGKESCPTGERLAFGQETARKE